MLAREKRLSRTDFDTSRTLSRAASAHFSLSYGPDPVGRAAAVISKKVAKHSADRHLLKRRCLALLEPHLAMPSRKVRLMLFARTGAASLPFPALKAELEALLRSAGI